MKTIALAEGRSPAFGYDQWANLLSAGTLSGYSSCAPAPQTFTVNANNQLTSQGSYDVAGNMLSDGILPYAWDAEGQMKSASGVNYTYDGDGHRVQKSNGKIYWYGAGSEILAESDASGNITDECVYFGGKRVAHRSIAGGASTYYYYVEDFLGSSRVITAASDRSVCYDADFLPFGQERVVVNNCAQNYKFSGKERDTETGNDDFGARPYSSSMGRWLSADWSAIPVPVPYANLTNPQTLNLYAMVGDNPETFADLDGHYFSLNLAIDSYVLFHRAEDKGNQEHAQPQDQQPQYDPAKSGPEDPTNPGTSLSQNPAVKKASAEAFVRTADGTARSGFAEADFAIDNKDGKISIANKVGSVNSDGPVNQLHIKTDADTIAILHTHGNHALPTPSPGDFKSPMPNFVRSQRELFVTVPGTTTYIQLVPVPSN